MYIDYGGSMFVDCEQYSFTRLMEDNWLAILNDYNALPPEVFVAWPEHHLYNFGWRAYGLVALSQPIGESVKHCPQTTSLLK